MGTGTDRLYAPWRFQNSWGWYQTLLETQSGVGFRMVHNYFPSLPKTTHGTTVALRPQRMAWLRSPPAPCKAGFSSPLLAPRNATLRIMLVPPAASRHPGLR
jgi:hypothetical protein